MQFNQHSPPASRHPWPPRGGRTGFCTAPCGVSRGRLQSDVHYDFVYVDEEGFKKYTPSTFQALMDGFREYKSN